MKMDAPAKLMILYLPFVVLLLCHVHQSTAADSIPSGRKLYWNQTIVSAAGVFELGFFSPGNSGKHYVGIWYKKIPRTFVWVANREKPIYEIEGYFLKVSEDGNLDLFTSPTNVPIWSSNTSVTISNVGTATEVVLLDTGNLVIRDSRNSSIIRWQSFDYPADTWLPEAHLGMNKVTGKYLVITSWKNSEDPAPGPFSLSLDPEGPNQLVVMWKRSNKYWESGVWNGAFYAKDAQAQAAASSFKLRFYDEETEKYAAFGAFSNDTVTRAVVEPSGKISLYVGKEVDQQMVSIWTRPMSQCDVYSLCGANGVCGQAAPPCQCSYGFQPVSQQEWGLNDWSSGCERKINLNCTGNNTSSSQSTDEFLAISGAMKPVNAQYIEVKGIDDCKSACLMNCTCTAYAYANSCRIWIGDLWNVIYSSDANSDTDTILYIRLAASELVTRHHKRNTATVVVICAAALVAIITGTILTWVVIRSRRPSPMQDAVDGTLIRFTYSSLQQVTKNFSDRLGGGSFGSVFKGNFPDSTVVAVKKLEHRGEGEKQFLTEVRSLGTIQHLNLVRLHGFCSEKEKRLLVYEYMPNGSLASQLFGNSSKCIDWKSRYNVALQTAKGLAYLHEGCHYCIIHCDIKPENILLDADYRPKVADLGLAKLLGRDFSRVLTTTRGTIGYLAPEWISGMPITQKADVYSYGMMMFEIISGKRNAEHRDGFDAQFFPVWVAKQVNEGEYLICVDDRLRGDINDGELIRACRAACWCIQDKETDRPSMRQVVQILEGILDLGVPPVPLTLQSLMEDYDTSSSDFPKLAFHSCETDTTVMYKSPV